MPSVVALNGPQSKAGGDPSPSPTVSRKVSTGDLSGDRTVISGVVIGRPTWSTQRGIGNAERADGPDAVVQWSSGGLTTSQISSSADFVRSGNGGGLRVTSPDGLLSRTIRIDNAGAVVAVA